MLNRRPIADAIDASFDCVSDFASIRYTCTIGRGYTGARLRSYTATWLHGARLHGDTVTRLQGTRLHGCMVARPHEPGYTVPGYTVTRLHGYTVTRLHVYTVILVETV